MTRGRPRSRAARLIRRIAVVVCLLLGASTLSSSAASDEDSIPGLPPPAPFGSWVGPQASGITETATAQQWVRLPPLVITGFSYPQRKLDDPSCRRLAPYTETTDWQVDLYFTSTPGAPEPFGYIGPFTVRTVAFGSIPVEADVRIAQPRDDENLPVPYEFQQTTATFCPGEGPHAGPTQKESHWLPFEVDTPVNVSVTGLRVDGVELGLSEGCGTVETSSMTLAPEREYFNLDPSITPEERPTSENLFTTPFFGAANGGLLTGTVDIPAFVDCRTGAGEDVSALLTATVSGEVNQVEVRSQGLETTDCINAFCEPLPELPFPEENE